MYIYIYMYIAYVYSNLVMRGPTPNLGPISTYTYTYIRI